MTRAEAKFIQISRELKKQNPQVLELIPVESYISKFRSFSETYSYKKMSLKQEKWINNLKPNFDKNAMPLYHRLVLAFLIRKADQQLENTDLPTDIEQMYLNWFNRVLSDLEIQSDNYYSYNEDLFLKDLAVCSLRMKPVGGAWTIDIESVSKRALTANGPRKYVNNVAFHLLKQKGLKPYYVIHTFDRYIMRFTAEEMEKAYIRIAGLMRLDPKIKGIYRGSWFLDPEIDRVSPRLAYLRRIPFENGARLFRIKTRELDTQRAIFNSPERKKLYRNREYKPARWAYVWPREEFLQWAKRQ